MTHSEIQALSPAWGRDLVSFSLFVSNPTPSPLIHLSFSGLAPCCAPSRYQIPVDFSLNVFLHSKAALPHNPAIRAVSFPFVRVLGDADYFFQPFFSLFFFYYDQYSVQHGRCPSLLLLLGSVVFCAFSLMQALSSVSVGLLESLQSKWLHNCPLFLSLRMMIMNAKKFLKHIADLVIFQLCVFMGRPFSIITGFAFVKLQQPGIQGMVGLPACETFPASFPPGKHFC